MTETQVHMLEGKTVLIVEDEVIIGMMLCKEIRDAGGTPIGPATSVCQALREMEAQTIDMVILDQRLVDGSGAELVTEFNKRGIPFVVTSGYEKENLPSVLKNAPFVAKPVSMPLLIEAMTDLEFRCSTAKAHHPE
jgi:DNA-binding NtrC family response regulator